METLKTSPNIVALQELQSLLQDAGIESHISENSSPYVDASGNTITYSLLVGSDNLDKALEIAKKFNETSENPTDCSWCPECGSEDISKSVVKKKRSSIAFLIIGIIAFALAFVIPLGPIFSWIFAIGGIGAIIQYFRGHTEERYVCNQCNRKFKRY